MRLNHKHLINIKSFTILTTEAPKILFTSKFSYYKKKIMVLKLLRLVVNENNMTVDIRS